MQFKNKKVLIVGLAKSGIAASNVLSRMGAKITINDIKSKQQLLSEIQQIKNDNAELYLGNTPDAIIDKVDIIVLSPGVPTDLPFISKAIDKGIEVISEVEAAYALCKAPIVAITGTNGKTTTTALTYHIFDTAGKTAFLAGNIGVPMISQVTKAKKDDLIIAEVSSFQLEMIKYFKPKVSALLNITEDHLNRHKTIENYLKAKANITVNQTQNDFLIINEDDQRLRLIKKITRAKIVPFSRKKILDTGVFVKDGNIIVKKNDTEITVCGTDEISIPGEHNLENVLAAVSICSVFDIDINVVRQALTTFEGVEHRLEFVDEINGITYINDSKATNPDAAIKALQAFDVPIVLIAGGMDKKSDFTQFLKIAKDKVRYLILLGETKYAIKSAADKVGIRNIIIVDTLTEAVKQSSKVAQAGDTVLMSPACASWDMFKSFEERGRMFKEAVSRLRR